MSPQSVVILQVIHPLLWLAWFIYWMISALGNKTTVRRETWAQRIPYTLPLVVSILLLLNPDLVPPLERRFWSQNLVTYWLGTALVASGLLFTVWARRTLGRNWSGTVTVKQDHELIQSGPYRWVRHPIYTGLLIALAGSAISMDFGSASWHGWSRW